MDRPNLSETPGSPTGDGVPGAKPRDWSTVILAFCLVALTIIPLKIIGDGFSPEDDALRHCAKVIAGKSWSEILVLSPAIYSDIESHPGWNFLLTAVHQVSGMDADGLMVFSIFSLWCLVCMPPLFFRRQPETFPAALLVIAWLDFPVIGRLFSGRPYVFTTGVLVALLFLWEHLEMRRGAPGDKKWPLKPLLAATLLVAAAVWVHSTFYLFAMPVGAALLTRKWRQAFLFSGAVLAGGILGTILSLHPLEHLIYQMKLPFLVLGTGSADVQLVKELQSYPSSLWLGLLMAAAAGVRFFYPRWKGYPLSHPAFFLAVIGWFLGHKVARFWTDWGAPALAVWLALEFRQLLTQYAAGRDKLRLILAGAVCLLLPLVTISKPWRTSGAREISYLQDHAEEMRPWLPDGHGIIYANTMRVFYQFFFAFPKAPWRYILGFESGYMPEADLAVYRRHRLDSSYQSLQPWVDKLRPEDRLFLHTGQPEQPPFPRLEWKFLPPYYWIGRLPRSGSATRPEAPSAISSSR